MANVSFKRGLLANLPSTKTDGAVYVTTDERAMYIDYDNSGTVQRIRIGDIIIKTNWAAIQALSAPLEGALYYAQSENILATHVGGTWKQINAQQSASQLVNGLTAAFVTETGGAKLNLAVKQGTTELATGSASIVATGSATVEASNNKLSIGAADTYYKTSIGTGSITGGGAKIEITETKEGVNAAGAAQSGSTTDSVNLKGSTGITVSASGDDITISGNVVTATEIGFSNTGVLGVTVKDTNSSSGHSDVVTPIITYGSTDTQAKFISGTADLNVYTISETDAAIQSAMRAANAMTFKGAIAAQSDIPTTDVSIGDTYKVSVNGTFTINGTSQICRLGDLIIAKAKNNTFDEVNGVLPANGLAWEYIPAGNDDTTMYDVTAQAATTGLLIKKNGAQIAGVVPGSHLTAAAGGNATLTLNHAAVGTGTAITPTAGSAITQTSKNNASITAVTGVSVDSYGHVAGITTQTFTATDTHNAVSSLTMGSSVSNNVATISSNVKTSDDSTGKSGSVTLTSSSLAIAKSGDNLTIDLTWGSF